MSEQSHVYILSAEEVAVVRSALEMPGCWNPRLRRRALALLGEQNFEQTRLPIEEEKPCA